MTSREIGVAIVGLGYWGPRLIRNFQNTPGFSVVALCDADPARCARFAVKSDYSVFESLDGLLQLEGVEAVAIATPVSTHYSLAKACLLAGKHVFLEKPFTRTSEQALELIALAEERDLTLAVDHTFLYTASVNYIKKAIEDKVLGDLLYYDSIRVNLGLFQSDVDVIWDLAPHDFSILDFVVPGRPQRISAIGSSHTPSGFIDLAYVTIDYGDGFLAHFHLNWLAPNKVRQVLIGGTKQMLTWDDVKPDTKIQLFDRGIDFSERDTATRTVDDPEGQYQSMISYRMGDRRSPWLDRTEALYAECASLHQAICEGTPLKNDGLAGLRVVLMLEAASQSLQADGAWISPDWTALGE